MSKQIKFHFSRDGEKNELHGWQILLKKQVWFALESSFVFLIPRIDSMKGLERLPTTKNVYKFQFFDKTQQCWAVSAVVETTHIKYEKKCKFYVFKGTNSLTVDKEEQGL